MRIVFCIGLIVAATVVLSAQTFEVATIKPTPPASAGDLQPSITMFPPGGGFRRTNATLKSLVRLAYDVQEFQVSGGPKWVETDRFDVEAKSEGNASRS